MTVFFAMVTPQFAAPYNADTNTLHLYHFDADGSDSAGDKDLSLANGAALALSVDGFGNAVSTYNSGTASARYVGDNVNKMLISELVGTNGAFTFEALVKPMVAQGAISHHMEIICLEDDGATGSERGFQFRINSDGKLRFQVLAGSTDYFDSAITFSSGLWYHVAVVYNGQENTANNLKLYWTPVTNATTVIEVGSFELNADLKANVDGYFSIGNELRPTTYTENFEGLIDEVRISSIARTPADLSCFIVDGLPVIVSQPQETVVRAGQMVQFECCFTAETLGQVNWYKAEGTTAILLQESDAEIIISQVYDPVTQEYRSYLTLENCKIADMGEYYFTVSDQAGHIVYSDRALLTVQGLWRHWPLDESSYNGSQYAELISGKNAQVQSEPAFKTGADQTVNGAVAISSNAGWAGAGYDTPMVLPGAFTISYWVNWQGHNSVSDDILVSTGLKSVITVTDGLHADEAWQHISVVFDGRVCKLYLDGLLAAESELVIPNGMSVSLDIGNAGLGTESFNGYLDDIRIYNYVLDELDIAQLRFDFSGERSCIGLPGILADWSGPNNFPDCTIDIYDLAAFAEQFLGTESLYDITGPSGQKDGIVDLVDFSNMANKWLACGLYPSADNN